MDVGEATKLWPARVRTPTRSWAEVRGMHQRGRVAEAEGELASGAGRVGACVRKFLKYFMSDDLSVSYQT
jgi:hypothetical protein